MTLDFVGSTCGKLSQPFQITASSVSSCTLQAHPLQMQHLDLLPSARHQCSRFCCFEPITETTCQCQTSRQRHVCGQECCERVFLNEQFDICRFSKILFPIRIQQASANRKRAFDGTQNMANTKRKAAAHHQASCPTSAPIASMKCM